MEALMIRRVALLYTTIIATAPSDTTSYEGLANPAKH